MGWEHVLPQFVLRMRELVKSPGTPLPFPIQGDGRHTRAFVFIDDFVDGTMIMMEKGEHMGIYHIGTQEEISMADVATLVGTFYDREINLMPGPEAAGGTLRRCPDISKLRALGYEPKISIKKGLPILAKWYDEMADNAPHSE
jgi:nucleoside-diphosphate-sugar epimerase